MNETGKLKQQTNHFYETFAILRLLQSRVMSWEPHYAQKNGSSERRAIAIKRLYVVWMFSTVLFSWYQRYL